MSSRSFLQETADLVKSIESSFLELGARLYLIRKDDEWQGHFESYEAFLEEARITPTLASILVKIHQYYIINHKAELRQLQGIGYSNLYEAIPLLEDEDVTTVLAKAKILTRAEIKQEVRDEAHPDCEHLSHIKICADCKKRIYEQE